MKKKSLVIVLIIILLLLIGFTFYAKYNNNNSNSKFKLKVLSNELNITVSTLTDDEIIIDEYEGYNSEVSYDSRINVNDKEVSYRLYIDNDDNLILKDNTNYKTKIFEKVKFKDIYVPDINNHSELYCYALSLDGDVYFVYLNTLNINDTTIKKINGNYKAKSFAHVPVPYVSLDDVYYKNTYVLTTDGKIRDVMMNTESLINVCNFQNEYLIYTDYTIINESGYILHNEKNEKYKMKYVILLNKKLELEGKPDILIITDNDELIYSVDKKLFKAKYGVKELYTESNDEMHVSKIRFTNGEYINVDGIRYSLTIEIKDEE